MCAVQLYKQFGYKCTVISDKEERENIMLTAGANEFLTVEEAKMSGHKHDYAIFLSSSWRYWYCCMKLSKPFGNIAVLGFPGRNSEPSENPLKPEWTYLNQLRIEFCGTVEEHPDSRQRSKCAESVNMSRIVDMIHRSAIDARLIITDIVDQSKLNSVYERLKTRCHSDNTFILNWK